MPNQKALVWLRRDLRLSDHSAFAHAESEGLETAVAFVFDEGILSPLPRDDRRVGFFHAALEEIDAELRERGSRLAARIGNPVKEIPKLARELGVNTVIASRDYEPSAITRDEAVAKELARSGIKLLLLKDQVVFDTNEILNGSGSPYKVFTAYKNNWLGRLAPADFDERGVRLPKLIPAKAIPEQAWDLRTLGFSPAACWLEPGEKAARKRLSDFGKKIADYTDARDIPSIEGTSGLSAHLRFGTVSIRACVREAKKHRGKGAETWLSELVWRDFYHMILSQFPHVGHGKAFREEYDKLKWPGKDAHFEAWRMGRTGFPLVDASMRHFNATGWMHNRMRMVVASFLAKDLLIDWRRGEAVFALGLLDFDFAANNGGWQWSASTGCDAQPYFRVFNPESQSRRFDPEGKFIRSVIPELRSCPAKLIHATPGVKGYPEPIVDHATQRDRAIALFKNR